MSGEDKGGFNLSVGGDVSGDVAQTIDKSQHQTTNVEGDATVTNTQISGDASELSAEQIEALTQMGATEEEVGILTAVAKDMKGAGAEMAPVLDRLAPVVKRLGGPFLQIAKGFLPAAAGPILDAFVE